MIKINFDMNITCVWDQLLFWVSSPSNVAVRARSSGFRDFKQVDKAESPPNLMKSKTTLNNCIIFNCSFSQFMIFLTLTLWFDKKKKVKKNVQMQVRLALDSL